MRHGRILNLREKIQKGWNLLQLEEFCIKRLKVSKPTAKSYIDEAADPYRKKYWEQHT